MTSATSQPAVAPRITVICGGLGGARLALALCEAGLDATATFITNVADDTEVGRLLVCPDTDAVIYALCSCFDETRGWGVRGDVFDAGAVPGGPAWFSIGRRDAEHHARRRELLDAGLPLSAATRVLGEVRGIAASVIPATDARLRTRVAVMADESADVPWLRFQEWLVRDRAPAPSAVRYHGSESATPAPGVLEAISNADVVLVAPSSPVASILPTLGLPGVRDALARRRLGSRPTLAISPVVLRRPPVLDRDVRRAHARAVLLAATGVRHQPVEVARLYRDVVDTFVLDTADAMDADAVAALGLRPAIAPTIMDDAASRWRLIRALGGRFSDGVRVPPRHDRKDVLTERLDGT